MNRPNNTRERVQRELHADLRAVLIAAIVIVGWLTVNQIVSAPAHTPDHTTGEQQ